MMEFDISSIFSSLESYLEKDQTLREEINIIIKSLEQANREIVTILQMIHKRDGSTDITLCCKQGRSIIDNDVKPLFTKLNKILLENSNCHYYKYHDHWKFVCQQMVFVISLIVYLESGILASYSDVATTLGIYVSKKEGFHLDLEDYLIGILHLPSELSRLAVNSVICGNYARPLHISQFVTELNAGFRLLNLKNDSLRKKFDALKYEVKKIEEVVYDIAIRGLNIDENKQNLQKKDS